MDIENALIFLIENEMSKHINRQLSWIGSNTPIYKYEDLIENPLMTLTSILDYCEIETTEDHFNLIIKENTFEKLSGGRETGQEDTSSHYRKGISGDWKNHMSPKVRDRFKSKFSEELIKSGYENNDEW